MKIVTWNVNSLKARVSFVEAFLDAHRPDVLALQELKLPDEQVPTEIFTSRGYHLEAHGQKQYNGVLLASLTPLREVERGLADGDEGQSRRICATTRGVRFINLYCPQGSSVDSPKFPYKLRFYDALLAALAGQDLRSTVILGDLNIALEARDIWDPVGFAEVPSFHPLERERLAALLALGLTDPVASRVRPGTYSFWDYRAGAFQRNQGMRIDHIYLGADLAARVRDAAILREWRKKRDGLAASDHAPVLVELDDSDPVPA